MARLSLFALLASGSVSALAAQPLTEFHYSVNWTAATGSGLGAGLAVEDLDGDGRDEVVAVSSNYWQILRRQGSRLREVWSSLPRGPEISEVRAVIEPTTGRSVVLLSAESTIELWDGRLRTKFDEITLPSASITTFLPADIDLDGELEIVACDINDLYLSDYATGALQLVKYGFGCTDLDLGQIDGDATPELLLAGNSFSGLVLDGATLAVDWAYLDGFSSKARFVQADADATEEIVTNASGFPDGSPSRVIDPDTSTILYTIPQAGSDAPVAAADLDGDGHDEIYVARYGTGDLEVLDAETGAQIGLLDRSGDARAIETSFGDVDGDGSLEIVAKAGLPEDGEGDGSVVAFDFASSTVEADTLLTTGFFEALATGDLDADGSVELIAGDRLYPYGSPGSLFSFSLSTGRELGTTARFGGQPAALATRDLELDGDADVCAAIGDSLRCFVGPELAEEWSFVFPGALSAEAIALADVRGDAHPELLAATTQNPAQGGPFVYAFDGATGLLRWRSADPDDETLGPFIGLLVADFLPDAGPEILGLTWSGSLFLFDNASGAMLTGPAQVPGAEYLALADLDSDPEDDLLIATYDGSIEIVDPATGAIESVLASVGANLIAFAAGDVTRDGVADFVYTTNSHNVIVWDLALGSAIWDSGVLGYYPGYHNSLLAGDLDNDTVAEIVVNTNSGFVIIESPLVEIFTDGVESGDTSAWSEVIP